LRTACCAGLPKIKSNLNGTKIPGYLSFRVLVAKAVRLSLHALAAPTAMAWPPHPDPVFLCPPVPYPIIPQVGITLVVSSGLPLGKEGPMVHIGAMVASLTSSLQFGCLAPLFELRLPNAQRS